MAASRQARSVTGIAPRPAVPVLASAQRRSWRRCPATHQSLPGGGPSPGANRPPLRLMPVDTQKTMLRDLARDRELRKVPGPLLHATRHALTVSGPPIKQISSFKICCSRRNAAARHPAWSQASRRSPSVPTSERIRQLDMAWLPGVPQCVRPPKHVKAGQLQRRSRFVPQPALGLTDRRLDVHQAAGQHAGSRTKPPGSVYRR